MRSSASLIALALSVTLAAPLLSGCKASSSTDSNTSMSTALEVSSSPTISSETRPRSSTPNASSLASHNTQSSNSHHSSEASASASSSAPTTLSVTWHQDIAPLVAEKCSGCHKNGGVAPFPLTQYSEAKPLATAIHAAVNAHAMPPWGARTTDECTPPKPYKDDLSLTDSQLALINDWVAGGAPEGDAAMAAAIPPAAELTLTNPDHELVIPSSITISGDRDRFVCFVLDPNIEQPVWLQATQVIPGNAAIAHHALIFIDANNAAEQLANEQGQYDCFGDAGIDDSELIGVWAPGMTPALVPDDMGTPLTPGAKIVVQMHYHPTSTPQTDDATKIALKWTTQEPTYYSRTLLLGNFNEVDAPYLGGEGYGLTTGPEFLVPAGAENHTEINRFKLPYGHIPQLAEIPLTLWMVGTHMHYAGKDMKMTLEPQTGDDICLIQTPEWDFDWQRTYVYDGAIDTLPKIYFGDSLTLRCTYNNSLSNHAIEHALLEQGLTEPVDIPLGDETLNEMCVGVLGFAVHKDVAQQIGELF